MVDGPRPVLALVLALAALAGATPATGGTRGAPPGSQLPRGGRVVFPHFRVVAYYGAAGTGALGVLGAGSPAAATRRLLAQARAYESPTRPVLPALELIATVAQAAAGPDGSYSVPAAPADVRRYLAAARAAHALLLLDVQPGRSDFLAEARRYERFLREPDVGLALDPEWKVGPGERPGHGHIGHTDAATVNRVSAWLAALVTRDHLPQKLLVVHQFTPDMVRRRALVRPRPGLAITFHVDGFGGRAAKRSKYALLHGRHPFFSGFKLFYRQDRELLPPPLVLGLRPSPDLVTYQ